MKVERGGGGGRRDNRERRPRRTSGRLPRSRHSRSQQCRPEPLPFQDIDEEKWIEVLRGNMVAPLLLMKAVIPGMRKRKFGRIINITSAMVTTPRPHMALSAAARERIDGGGERPIGRHRAGQCDHQQYAARAYRHRPPASDGEGADEARKTSPTRRPAPNNRIHRRKTAGAGRKNSARPARFYAANMRDTSPVL